MSFSTCHNCYSSTGVVLCYYSKEYILNYLFLYSNYYYNSLDFYHRKKKNKDLVFLMKSVVITGLPHIQGTQGNSGKF